MQATHYTAWRDDHAMAIPIMGNKTVIIATSELPTLNMFTVETFPTIFFSTRFFAVSKQQA
jgi:hypothetical protein